MSNVRFPQRADDTMFPSARADSAATTIGTANLQNLLLTLGGVLRRIQQPQRSLSELVDAKAMLQSATLPAAVVAKSIRHLTNAARYLKYGESGAARWELQALRKSLSQQRI